MRPLLFLVLIFFIFSCGTSKKPDIIYEKGDLWISNFVNNAYPSKAFKDDKIYCSSLLIEGDVLNRFYCLNLNSGKVDWAIPVKSWASQPPIICDSFIYYCSYVGDIYKFDKSGSQIWYTKLPTTYGGHAINPINNNLLVGTVAYGLREIDCTTGDIIDSVGYGKMDVPFPIFKQDTIFQVIDDSLLSKSFATNSIYWSKKIGTNVDGLFLNMQHLYYFDNTQRLYCLDYKTGALLWKSDSVFHTQPYGPHLEFEKGKIFSYFSDLNEIFVIDITDGKIQQKTNYEKLQKENYLVPAVIKYVVTNNKKKYNVNISNTLFLGFDFRKSFDVTVEETH